jgi:UDP-2,3-diacylglucosamine hydrolase
VIASGPMRAVAPFSKQGPVALICAGGALPFAVAEAMQAAGRSYIVVGIAGIGDRGLDQLGVTWLALGQLGKLFALLRRERCSGVVLIGAINRPTVRSMRIDSVGWTYLIDFFRIIRRGDDAMLRGMMRWFEDQGIPVLGIGDVAPDLLAPEGRLGEIEAPSEALDAARLGFACLDALSPFDVGQALIAFGDRIVAIEGAEGTDALLDRVAELRRLGRLPGARRSGVLLKAAKQGQSLKADLPVVGPITMEGAARAQLAGVVVEAGRLLMVDVAATVAAANAAGLFLQGMRRGHAA